MTYFDEENKTPKISEEITKFLKKEYEFEQHLKSKWQDNLKNQLENVDDLFEWLEEEQQFWMPEEVVEVYETDEKTGGYSNYQHIRIKDDPDKLLYLKQNENEIEGIDHYCVWQKCGILGDEYSGWLLFPLKNGKYLKVYYSC